ncbi:hypothetical protein FGB62_22g338 [Gracilaria domingensis]|nr:hypothetical protein FGB62_22g338 [Gracilaria domingensis]
MPSHIRVDCEVIAYSSTRAETANAGMHCVQYEDGITEWKKLTTFRVVQELQEKHARPLSSESVDSSIIGDAVGEAGAQR